MTTTTTNSRKGETMDDPKAVVVVTIDGNDYTATNNGDGTWTLADNVVATLAEGSYPTSVSATDAAGNTVTNTGTLVIDTTAPTVAINDLTTNDTTPELTGTVNDPNAVVVVTIDGNDYTATNNGDGTWTLADNIVALLAEGNYTAIVTATDAVGNVATDTGTVVIDTSIDENNNGQTVTFDSISNDSGVAGDFITSDSTLIFNGTVDLGDNTTLTVTVDGTSYIFGTDPVGTVGWTITNPPFRLAQQFIAQARNTSRHGVAVIVRSAFLEGIGRYNDLFSTGAPSDILQFSERVVMHKGKLSAKGSTATAYCWLVWRKNDRTVQTRFDWIPPSRKRLELPEDYL